MIRLIARFIAKKQYIFKLEHEGATNDINAQLAQNRSQESLAARMPGRADAEHMSQQMMIKRADFLVSVSRFMMVVTLDPPGWITLGLNHDRMPNVEAFRDSVENVATPFLNLSQDRQIPEKSYIAPQKS